MGDTTIEWTDRTWNPTRGCRRKSTGCENCYAERQAIRFAGTGGPYEGLVKGTPNGPRWTGKGMFVAEHLADPLRWRKPQRIFVDSMSDLFYEEFTNEQIAAVFGVMAAAPQHTFQILTKRPERMRRWFEWVADRARSHPSEIDPQSVCAEATECILGSEDDAWNRATRAPSFIERVQWPHPNVWLGVSVEDQQRADERIPELLRTPAAVRFLSCEPLLGPVRLDDGESGWLTCRGPSPNDDEAGCCETRYVNGPPCFRGIDWVIAGCESGPGARPCDVAWLRSLRDQCAAAGVPYFLKQAVCQMSLDPSWRQPITFGDGSHAKGNVIGLPYLDGKQHAGLP